MSIRLKIIGTLALIVPVMLVFAGLFQFTQNKNKEQRHWVDHTYQVINQVNDVLSDMQDAETAQRGYIITSDVSFLEPYNISINKVDADLAQLYKLTQDYPIQQQHLHEFEPIMRNQFSYLAKVLAIRKEQGLQAAVSMVATKTGKKNMDQIRAILGEMINIEQRLLIERGAEYKRMLDTFYKIQALFIFVIGFTTFIMGFVLIHNILRPLRALNKTGLQLGAGDYTARIHLASRDEFNHLATTFNAMAEAIQSRSQELSNIFSSMADGLIIVDSQGDIRTLNPAAEQMFDTSTEDLLGKHLSQLLPDWTDDEQFTLASTGYRSERNGQRNDGSLFPVAIAFSDMQINGNRLQVCLLRDISEQKNMQQALVENEARLHTIINTVVDGIITIDSQGSVETMNHAAETIFAYPANEVIGRNIKMLMPEPYYREHDGYLQHYLTTGQAKVIGIGREVVGRRKDGSVFPMDLAVSEMSINSSRKFTGLVRDITERKKIDAMKNEFISTVSHELRTPLTSIQGALELVLSGVMGTLPDECTPLMEIAHNNSSRLVRLINDILDIEKIESGKMEFHVKPIEIMAVVQQALAANQAYANEYGVSLLITSQIDPCYVMADSDRLLQVLTNLLSNAAKFSSRGETVEIAVAKVKNIVRVSVTDYGSGIPDDFKDHIFSKFAQADASSTKQKGGTGLGLSISKAIIETLGGTLDYTSEINKETSFYFDLPIYYLEITPVRTEPDNEVEVILICEDDPDVANLLKLMLEKNGHVANIALSAEQAKHMLHSKRYAALTLDLMLPGQSGIEFFKELRQTEGLAELPVIVISAIAEKSKAELNGHALSVSDWLDKPIDQQRLESVISRVLENKSDQPVRILHVEDDPDIVTLVKTLLKNQATVDLATDLETANIKLQQHYDLIILDMLLPDGSGSSLLSSIAHRNPPIPVVVFSALENTEAFKNSVNAFLVKSKTNNQELIQSIESILKHKTKPVKESRDV